MKSKEKNFIMYSLIFSLLLMLIFYGSEMMMSVTGDDELKGTPIPIPDPQPDIIDRDCYWCDDGLLKFGTYKTECPEGTFPQQIDCEQTLVSCYWCDNGESMSSTFYDACPVGTSLEEEYCPPRLVTCFWCDNGERLSSTFENDCPSGKYDYMIVCDVDEAPLEVVLEPEWKTFVDNYWTLIVVLVNIFMLIILAGKKTED